MPSENPEQRFEDIIENISRIEKYTSGVGREVFLADLMRMDAVERCLSRISEAAVKLGDVAEKLAPNEEWANIRGFGNHLRHGYDGVDPELIWLIVVDDLPGLKAACEEITSRI